ncbi:hypothetical protein SUGI_0853850 [Cryptomeria japonica]|nr:hypothetical protein SUGI_0853850 [Cryptomeria japonica]
MESTSNRTVTWRGEKALADSKVRKLSQDLMRTSLAEYPLENRGLTSSGIDLELYGSAVLSLHPLHRSTTHIQSGEPFRHKCFWTVAKLTASWDGKEQFESLKGWGTDQHGIYGG